MIDSKLLTEMAQQVPSAVAVIIVVIVFVRYLQNDRVNQRSEREAMHQFLKDLHQDHLAARIESQKELERNTIALRDHAVTTQKSIDTLAALAEAVRQCKA